MWSQSTNVTDRRTDGRHAIPRPRICTKVHCAVKILAEDNKNWRNFKTNVFQDVYTDQWTVLIVDICCIYKNFCEIMRLPEWTTWTIVNLALLKTDTNYWPIIYARVVIYSRRSSVNFGGGGNTFCPKIYVWKINKMPEFYLVFATKKLMNCLNFTWYLSKKIFFQIFWEEANLSPLSPFPVLYAYASCTKHCAAVDSTRHFKWKCFCSNAAEFLSLNSFFTQTDHVHQSPWWICCSDQLPRLLSWDTHQ